MKYIFIALLFVLIPMDAFSGFGGNRSSTSRSYSRPSYSRPSPSPSFGGFRSAPKAAPSAPSVSARPSFGGNRASNSGPATITRPAPAPQQPQAPSYSPPPQTVIVHHDSNSHFWSNMFLYQALTNNNRNNQPVIINNGQPGTQLYDAAGNPVQQQGTTYQTSAQPQEDSGHGFFFWVFTLLVVGGIGYAVLKFFAL